MALLLLFTFYTAWFIGPGYFGQLSNLEGHTPLQERVFYTGDEALTAVKALSEESRRIKYLALIFDFPYMILQALLFEAMIAFGVLQMRLSGRFWQWLFILPIVFLLADVLEDSALLLLLSTSTKIFGSVAGIMTAVKFLFFIPACFVSLAFLIGGLFAKAKRRFLS